MLYRLRAACFAQRARAFTDLAPRITRAKVRYPPCNPPSPWISPPYNGHSAGVRWAPRVVRGVDRGGLGGESSAWRRCQAPVRGEPHPPRQSQRCAVPPAMGRGGARKRWGDKVQVGGRLPSASSSCSDWPRRSIAPHHHDACGERGGGWTLVKRLARLTHWEASPPHSRSLGVAKRTPPPLRCMRGARGWPVGGLVRLAHWTAPPPRSSSLAS